jgi:hypothetical protein
MEIENLQAELEFAGTRLARALENAENVRLTESQVENNISQKYTLIDAPDLAEKPAVSRRQMAMNAGIFLAVGVLLSCIAVIGATVLELSFRFPVDVTHELDLPVLAVVPNATVLIQKECSQKRWKKVRVSGKVQEPLENESLEAPISVNLQDLEAAIKPEQLVENRSKDLFR